MQTAYRSKMFGFLVFPRRGSKRGATGVLAPPLGSDLDKFLHQVLFLSTNFQFFMPTTLCWKNLKLAGTTLSFFLDPRLVFPEVQETAQNFEQLASSGEHTWGLNFLGGTAYAIFASSQETTYKRIFNCMELLNDTYECYEKAATSRFACIAWRSFGDRLRVKNSTDSKGRSGLETAREFTYFVPCGWGLEKRAIFKGNFDRALHMGHVSGLIQKWEEMDEYAIKKRGWDWEKSMNDSHATRISYGGFHGEEARPIQVKNLRGGIYFCLAGILLSLAVFAMEELKVFDEKAKVRVQVVHSNYEKWQRVSSVLAFTKLFCQNKKFLR